MRAKAGLLGIVVALSGLSACASRSSIESATPSTAPTSDRATASARTPEPDVSASPSTPPETLTWTQVPFAGTVDGVIALRGGYVAVGTIDRVPTAWTSADGEDWQSHAVAYKAPDGDFPGLPGPRMGSLVEHDGWLYAIGAYRGAGDTTVPLGWRSQDGRSWEQISSRNPFYTDGYLVLHLVSGDAGLLALTRGFADRSGGVWLWTPDGSWQEVTPQMPATSAGADFTDATWADGQYVVVGNGSDGGDRDASTWTSTDGRTWEITTPPYPWESNLDPLGVVTAVAPTPEGTWSAFLAAPGRAVGLYSTDARSWEVTQDMMGTWSGRVETLTRVGDRLLAGGGADAAFTAQWGGEEGSWILVSYDGRTWHESFRTDDVGAPVAIASNGTSVVAFGSPLMPESSRGSVLLRLPSG